MESHEQEIVTIQIPKNVALYFRTFLMIQYHELDEDDFNEEDREIINLLWSAIVDVVGEN